MFIYICISLVRIVSLFSSFLFHFIFKIPKKKLNLNLSHNLNTNAKIQELQHEMHILIFFICYLINMFPLTEYAQRKGNQIIPKTLLYTYLFIFIIFTLYKFYGFTNPTPLNRNLVPEICKDRDVKSFIYSLLLISN
jgi:hypothetical protein